MARCASPKNRAGDHTNRHGHQKQHPPQSAPTMNRHVAGMAKAAQIGEALSATEAGVRPMVGLTHGRAAATLANPPTARAYLLAKTTPFG
jgi:hypothetical protein